MIKEDKKTNKDIVSLISSSLGIDPTKVSIKNHKSVKKRKKRKRKTTVVSNIGFDKIKCGYKFEDKNVNDWSTPDFYYFVGQLYYRIYKKDFNLNLRPACLEINKLHDILYDKYGKCPNIMLKDYILFFFEKYSSFMQKSGEFYFVWLRNKDVIGSFDKLSYNCHKNTVKSFKAKKENDQNILSNREISALYFVSEESMLRAYGPIVMANWLVRYMHFSIEDAKEVVLDNMKRITNKVLLYEVKNVTERLSPYPRWLKITEIGTEKWDISFNNGTKANSLNNKFAFLKDSQ
jgi:hypothetical protein